MSAWQVNAVGWCSVLLLFTTMAGQAWKQWSEHTTKGIGRWFFVGQIAASIGFICYSALQGDAVFVAGNSLVLLAAVSGGGILWWNRTHRAAPGAGNPAQ
ncbi:MAG: hypothetical protein ABI981_04555 [Betaproteobacteria bacterium]